MILHSEYIKNSLIIAQILLALFHDIKEYKIKNYIPLVFILLGFLYDLIWGKPDAFYSGFLGLVIPFILLFPLYTLRMLGAGDIKLLCSLGILLGPLEIFYCILYSFAAGGFLAILLMAFRKNLHPRFVRLASYLKSCILTMSWLPYEEVGAKHQARMHFSIPIALAVLIINYLGL
jgi:prepilin peptidase CpaA